MKAISNMKYPIFEADQVLSQNHLNTIVSYLEEQDRLTRTGAIGIGTICGMEITFPNINSVRIGCGTAITSLGFQIDWEEKTFQYYKNIELPETFLHPKYTTEPFLAPIFEQSEKYSRFKYCTELIHVPLDNTDPLPDGVKTITNASFFKDKVIMLLLEVSLIDVKKCGPVDCDDKGKKLEFKIRPILVEADKLEEFINPYRTGALENPLYIERFNVPQTTLITGYQVLSGFRSKMNDALLSRITSALNSLYKQYKDEYEKSIDSFSILENVRPKLDSVIRSYRNSIAVQYVYRWLVDITEAYNEIYNYDEQNTLSSCCANDAPSLFPLHILLGKIITRRAEILSPGQLIPRPELLQRYFPRDYNVLDPEQAYRTPWLKVSPELVSGDKETVRLLLERMIYMLNYFSIPTDFADTKIKITPSVYGKYALSEKAIPYYYDKNAVTDLNKLWSPTDTQRNRNTTILSYNADIYSSAPQVIAPLNYELEPYNFLRIEGHIGQNYEQVVATLNGIKNTYRLPFDIIAVNAVDLKTGNLNMANYTGDWGEIQLSYEIISRRWEDVIGKCIYWFEHNLWVTTYISQEEYNDIVNHMKLARDCTYREFSRFLPLYTGFIRYYERIEALATLFRDRVFKGLTEIIETPKGPESRYPFDVYSEEFIDHLDQIIFVCSKGQFRALYQNAQIKWASISKAITFKTFIEQHSGMMNAGGVTTMGTFIIVYQDNSAVVNPMIKVPPRTQVLPVKEAGIKIKEPKQVIFSPTIEDYTIKIKAFAKASLDRNNYINLERYLDESVFVSPVKDTVTIPDKAVIADFFLPYQSGKGNILNFIVNPVDPTPPGAADFESPDFQSPDFFAKELPVKS